MQVTGATVDSCFVLVRTHKHGIAFQPQAIWTKQLSRVAPVTCIVVTWVKPVVRMRVGSGQIGEKSGGLCFLPFYCNR